ncbi:MAG: hypothetical protein QXO47_10910 [Thermoproteota archaeon]
MSLELSKISRAVEMLAPKIAEIGSECKLTVPEWVIVFAEMTAAATSPLDEGEAVKVLDIFREVVFMFRDVEEKGGENVGEE